MCLGTLQDKTMKRDRRDKTISLEELLALRQSWSVEGLVVVWTNGCFDLLHVGHIDLLDSASNFGDRLIVGLNSDESVKSLKGPGRPIVSAEERAALLSALEVVDFVLVYNDLLPIQSIESLRPDVCCKGADYSPPYGQPCPEANVVASYGGRMQYIELTAHWSTTAILARLPK